MSEERFRPTPHREGPPSGGDDAPGSGPSRQEIRERADRLRAQGSGIIRSALSGDSQRYVDQGQQHGGQ